ncbi:PREDICTED: SCAN domain-containing protein 3-like [Thamnophis sirtalis]|uniref:SCAN domain-containing protein 3-like n=1 Tax=Thamnophis sirtalis TaxID=35019 RepID=A0A6I9X7W3_9SAUR|nr:PREDICTED: SCAN domain-containing protein 3-like [Thamnophis sirtalis]
MEIFQSIEKIFDRIDQTLGNIIQRIMDKDQDKEERMEPPEETWIQTLESGQHTNPNKCKRKRKDKILKLKNGLTTQQNAFVKQKQVNISSLRASFQVAKLISRTGRPFVEEEFVKECLLSVAKEMCPEKTDLFSTVSLSGPTITRRIEEMGDNLHQHLQNSSKNLCYFSLALDTSNDVRDSAQLLIFIRGTNDYFEVTEELAALKSIKGRTTGEDIFKKVHKLWMIWSWTGLN